MFSHDWFSRCSWIYDLHSSVRVAGLPTPGVARVYICVSVRYTQRKHILVRCTNGHSGCNLWFFSRVFLPETKFPECSLVILIFNQIDKWIYSAIEVYHCDTEFEINSIPISIITQIIHKVIYLVMDPANNETNSDEEHGFNCIISCHNKFVVYVTLCRWSFAVVSPNWSQFFWSESRQFSHSSK